MLTAAAATEDLVDGLGLGADDYLPKPFDFPVLVARIGALFRRAQPAIPPVLCCGDLVVDTARRMAWRAGRPLDLAPKEFGVLELLLAAGGRTVSAEELLERVWDENADPFTAAVKITVSRLRAKLGEPPLIDTRAKVRVPDRGAAMSPGCALTVGTASQAAAADRAAAPDPVVRRAVPGLRGRPASRHLRPGRPGLRRPDRGQRPVRPRAVGASDGRSASSVHGHGGERPILHELLTRSEMALAVMAVLSVALGWLVAGRALRPVRTITAAARQISVTSLSDRLALRGPDDELKELGDTFDGLLARLEASFRAQRQFIANASHELRTPLARQRVISQVALADPGATVESLRTAHERVLAAGAEQQQLIDALLTLATGAGRPARAGALRPGRGDRPGPRVPPGRGAERNLTLHAALGPAPAVGSPRLAERLVANLVDNALRHNVPGGRVEVSTGTRDCRAVVSVANTGPADPAGRGRPALPAVPAARRGAHEPRRRLRPWPVDRPGHRRGARRQHHRPAPTGGRAGDRGRVPS